MKLPLDGLIVLEFCQYMAGPWAGLRLADLGARVIKIERPGKGEACRSLVTKDLVIDGDSLVFHTANRGKESYAANLKDVQDLTAVKKLIARADVMTHNFRPGVMERIGLDYESASAINPGLVYASITGYGSEGPWRDKPGQDLLAQSVSGVTFLSGKASDPPTPLGLAVGDGICGLHAAQGILAALIQRGKTGRGAYVEVDLLSSLIDLQFEALTTHLNDGHRPPQRSHASPGHPYQGAPYGVYATSDGHLVLAMGRCRELGELLGIAELQSLDQPSDAFTRGDELREAIATKLVMRTTAEWLGLLEPAGVWCADVLDYERLRREPGYEALGMEQTVTRDGDHPVATLRCPIRIDGERLYGEAAAPRVGQDNEKIEAELLSS